VSLGQRLQFEIHALGENLLEMSDNSYLLDDVHLSLRHGAVRVGNRSRICNYALVKSSGEVLVGADTTISHFCVLHCDERIEIGDHCGVGERVTMVDSTHPHDGTDHPHLLHPIRTAPITIGRNVFVGTNATIGAGTAVGANAMIAAGSVLTGKEYPASWLTGGAPARPIRELAPGELSATQPRR
jgi:acetyltransferase-like isoleucine patch superfamily enzyme